MDRGPCKLLRLCSGQYARESQRPLHVQLSHQQLETLHLQVLTVHTAVKMISNQRHSVAQWVKGCPADLGVFDSILT